MFLPMKNVSLDVRGEGTATFLYLRSRKRAVEISVAEPGLFVEYWSEVDEASDAAAVKSDILFSTAQVFWNVVAWLYP